MEIAIQQYIDHTILRPDATLLDIEKLCREAVQYEFAAVCINPCWVQRAYQLCATSNVKVCTVIGFPLGANHTEIKASEALLAVKNGAEELDMVINIGYLKLKNYDLVEKDIIAVVQSAKNAIVKVIIETCLLSDQEKVMACEIAKKAGAHYVKTSTGFAASGAKVEDIKLMRGTVGESVGVKASGGVRDYLKAKEMIEAGATRIGTSSGVSIIAEAAQFNKLELYCLRNYSRLT